MLPATSSSTGLVVGQVWGGVALEGRTNLHVLTNGTLSAVGYRDEILKPIIGPYAGAVGPGFLLVLWALGSSWCRAMPFILVPNSRWFFSNKIY